MKYWIVACLCIFISPQIVCARTEIDSISPINTITSESIEKSGSRNIADVLNSLTTPADQGLANADMNLAQTNLRNNLVLINGRRLDKVDPVLKGFAQDLSSIPTAMIDRIEVLKDGASSVYGRDAVGGVVNLILKKDWDLHPQELPEPSAFTLQENQWLANKIPIGRIGLNENQGQYTYGLSTYNTKEWSWAPGLKLGESYGLSGPIIALGKTPQGPALSIYNDQGVFIGDVNKAKININPGITSQYLLRAQYPTLNLGYKSTDRTYAPGDFNPYGVMILPQGRSMGDLFQTGDMLNNNLLGFKNYDDYLDAMDEGCVPPYSHELVFTRHVLDIVPNDPLYPQPKAKKKKSGFLSKILPDGSGLVPGIAIEKKKGPDVNDQYSLPQIGFFPQSDPQSAWNAVDSKPKNVTVAVIDSGLDLSHPDGPEYVWINDKETPDNKIDDDQNGYVDDVHGWNFLDENNDLKDLRGHGTVVAGIIAARTNNGKGMAGINPGAVIMPLKVADKHGNTNSLNIFRAVKYAVAHGARVINISLGAQGVSDLERLAMNYARARGVLVVVASGNSGEDISLHSPASVGSVLAVGSVNFDGTRSTVSNVGANNALMAPGEEIYSLQSKDAPWEGPAGSKERLYTKLSGTSFSAPMVAATASLLLVKDPQLRPDDMEDILLSTAKRMTEEAWQGRTGAGVLDAAKALNSIESSHFNVKVTGLKKIYKSKSKLEAVDVYATVRGDVDYFTVEVGKGKHARSFQPVIGLAGQQASDDLVAHITEDQLRGSQDWLILVRAKDKAGKEYLAQLPLTLK